MKVVVFPKDKNPYQDLLYNHMPKEVEVSYLNLKPTAKIIQLTDLLLQAILYRLKGYTHFHLHWLYPITIPSPFHVLDKVFKILTSIYICFFVVSIKLLGYKLIWTIHNVTPHEKQTINDEFITWFLCKIANAKIVHSKDTIDRLSKIKASTKNTSIIQMGSYVDMYPNTTTKKKARIKLDIDQKKFTFLFLGLVRKYKGIHTLLETFEDIIEEYPNTQLIIAGKCIGHGLKESIIETSKKLKPAVIPILKTVPDEDLQYYFAAADVVVLPFKRVTTSSSVILALSFGKAIIYPKVGNMKDLPENVGIFYNPKEPEGLKIAMIKALNKKRALTTMGKAAFIYADSLSWESIAFQTYKLYSS